MNQTKHPPEDNFQIRCPKLGHQIHFSYCAQENLNLPCPRTLDCWYLYFDVRSFLIHELSAEEWHRSFEQPAKPKMASIMEMLRNIQGKNIKTDD
jgi:hypothetical protein